MVRWHWLYFVPLVCLVLVGCDKNRPKKPDPTKGVVTGIVLCADTGKPARFATVTLSAAPKKDRKNEQGAPLPSDESTVTDLEGRFRLEAVEPGHYYAFATLEGYLDPMRGLDFTRIGGLVGNQEQEQEAIKQWKDHLTEVAVYVHRASDLTLQVERAGEIAGTVTYDDGSPAIGMHFQLLRKVEKNGWSDVGLALFADWSIPSVSDGHGHYSVSNLSAGEYTVCTRMPNGSQDSAGRICLGNTFRRKNAKTIKVNAGESVNGIDIVIPLSGLHTVAGTVSAVADGHALGRGTVRLLYADDREKAREIPLEEDGSGSFTFQYVAEGNYILQVSSASEGEQEASNANLGNAKASGSKTIAAVYYTDKEIPLMVMSDLSDIQVTLEPSRPDKALKQ